MRQRQCTAVQTRVIKLIPSLHPCKVIDCDSCNSEDFGREVTSYVR